MAKVSKPSVERVKKYLLSEVEKQAEVIGQFKAQAATKLIGELNENMNEVQMGHKLRDIGQHIRFNTEILYRHAMGQVN